MITGENSTDKYPQAESWHSQGGEDKREYQKGRTKQGFVHGVSPDWPGVRAERQEGWYGEAGRHYPGVGENVTQ